MNNDDNSKNKLRHNPSALRGLMGHYDYDATAANSTDSTKSNAVTKEPSLFSSGHYSSLPGYDPNLYKELLARPTATSEDIAETVNSTIARSVAGKTLQELMNESDRILKESQELIDRLSQTRARGRFAKKAALESTLKQLESETLAPAAPVSVVKEPEKITKPRLSGSTEFQKKLDEFNRSVDDFLQTQSSKPVSEKAPPNCNEVKKLLHAAKGVLRDYSQRLSKELISQLQEQIDHCQSTLDSSAKVSAATYGQLQAAFTRAANALYG